MTGQLTNIQRWGTNKWKQSKDSCTNDNRIDARSGRRLKSLELWFCELVKEANDILMITHQSMHKMCRSYIMNRWDGNRIDGTSGEQTALKYCLAHKRSTIWITEFDFMSCIYKRQTKQKNHWDLCGVASNYSKRWHGSSRTYPVLIDQTISAHLDNHSPYSGLSIHHRAPSTRKVTKNTERTILK